MAFVRCKGPDGAEFTVDETTAAGYDASVKVLTDKDAVDVNGRPIPPKYDIHKGGPIKAASDKKEG